MTSTEGKKVEEELAWAWRLVNASGVFMIVANEEGKIRFCNKALQETFGYLREEVVGKPLTKLMPKDSRESHQRAMRKFLTEERRPKSSLLAEGLRKDGSKFPIEWVLSSFKTESEEPMLIGVGRDITQRKKREANLEALQQVSRQLKLAKSKEEIYGLVIDCTKQIIGYRYCAILELKADSLEVVKERGHTLSGIGERLSLDGKGITVASLNENKSLYIPDVEKDERYIGGIPGARCEYTVPISVDQQKYGVLNVESDKVDSISPVDRNLFEILASEMAVALEGLERLGEIGESRAKLRELHHAVDRLQDCGREQEICEMVVKSAERILNFDICSLDLVEGDLLIPKAVSTGLSLDESRPYHIGEGIAGTTVKKGETIWGEDLREFSQAKPTRSDFRAFISVPIGKLGVCQVASTQVGKFTNEDVELAEILAAHLREEIKRVRLQEELRQQAIRDPLTGLYNRRYFNQTIEKEVKRSSRYGHPVGFLMLDVNRLKEVNDRFSHLVGDQVLKELGDLLKENIRDADTVVRYGGDEFLIMLPETDRETEEIESRITTSLKEWNRESDLIDFPLTLAMGSSYWSPDQDKEIEEVLKEADRKMYKAKGRR